eukprot:3202935-Amphidinium_carterae.1
MLDSIGNTQVQWIRIPQQAAESGIPSAYHSGNAEAAPGLPCLLPCFRQAAGLFLASSPPFKRSRCTLDPAQPPMDPLDAADSIHKVFMIGPHPCFIVAAGFRMACRSCERYITSCKERWTNLGEVPFQLPGEASSLCFLN